MHLALAGLEGAHVVPNAHAGHAPGVGGGGPGPVHASRTGTQRHHLKKLNLRKISLKDQWKDIFC
jgi:hypothetical protein